MVQRQGGGPAIGSGRALPSRGGGWLWAIANGVQAAFTALWSAGWITVALVVIGVTRRPGTGLVLARRCWAPGLLWVAGARVEAQDLDRLDPTRAAVFAANHQSIIDVPVLFSVLPVGLHFVAKRELGRIPFLGWFMRAVGTVLVDRRDRLEVRRSLEASAALLRQGGSLLSFPEGTRSRDGRLAPFKKASFAAAIEAGAPVVPVAIRGAGAVLPADGFRVRPGRILVSIGAPIDTDGLTAADRAALAARVEEAVGRMLGESGELTVES